MVLSMVLMATFGVNSFQTDPLGYGYPKEDRSPNKYFHAILLSIALLVGFIGIYCASAGGIMDSSDWPFHQYMGIIALTCMCSNMLLGFIKFILNHPIFGEAKEWVPTHRNVGILSMICCYSACLSGAYEWGYCGHDEGKNDGFGCEDGLVTIFLLIFSLIFFVGSLHPAYLHPEDNKCITNVMYNISDKIEEEMTGQAPRASLVYDDVNMDGSDSDYDSGASTGSGSSYSSYDTDDESRKQSIKKHTTSSLKKLSTRKPVGCGQLTNDELASMVAKHTSKNHIHELTNAELEQMLSENGINSSSRKESDINDDSTTATDMVSVDVAPAV
jgi:hypothetical protein